MESERVEKVIEFYVAAMKKYHIQSLMINVDSQNRSDIGTINKMLELKGIRGLRAQGANKVGLNSPEQRVKNLSWLLTEKRLFIDYKIKQGLEFELSTARIDSKNRIIKKGKSQYDRIDALTYAYGHILGAMFY